MATLKPYSGDYRRHEAGQLYEAHLRSYDIREGDYGDFILWALDGDTIEPDTALMCSATLSKRSKLGGWVKLLYPTYDFETEFDLDTLIGMSVMVLFEHSEREDGGWDEKGKIVAKGTSDPKSYSDEAPF